jgi:hypothetical protein
LRVAAVDNHVGAESGLARRTDLAHRQHIETAQRLRDLEADRHAPAEQR